MFSFRDLFQWERFVTPSIIKLFFWLAVAIVILFGLSGISSALQMMTTSTLFYKPDMVLGPLWIGWYLYATSSPEPAKDALAAV